jgi:hypothetical protein
MDVAASSIGSRDPDESFDEAEAARLLKYSVRTLQARRVRGGGPDFVKIGRSVRYVRRDLIAFRSKHTVNSTTEAAAGA